MLLGDGEVGGVDLEEGGGGGDGVAAGVGVSGDGGRDDSVLDFSVASVAQAPKPRGFNLKRDAEHVVHRDLFDIERHVQVNLFCLLPASAASTREVEAEAAEAGTSRGREVEAAEAGSRQKRFRLSASTSVCLSASTAPAS